MKYVIFEYCLWMCMIFYLAAVMAVIVRCIEHDIKDGRLLFSVIIPIILIIHDLKFVFDEVKDEKKLCKKISCFYQCMHVLTKFFQIGLGISVEAIRSIEEVKCKKKKKSNLWNIIITLSKTLGNILSKNENKYYDCELKVLN